MPGRYYGQWPVYVVGDDPKALAFSVAVDDRALAVLSGGTDDMSIADDASTMARRRYITALTRRRAHQVAFRERILQAYREQCALCKLHHTAFDAFFLSVRPDYVIEVRRDVLEEIDGPVLQHALQGLHGKSIELPRRVAHRPDRDRLRLRHQRLLEAAG